MIWIPSWGSFAVWDSSSSRSPGCGTKRSSRSAIRRSKPSARRWETAVYRFAVFHLSMVFFNVPLRAAPRRELLLGQLQPAHGGSSTQHRGRPSTPYQDRSDIRIQNRGAAGPPVVGGSLAAPFGQVSRAHEIGGEGGRGPGSGDLLFRQHKHLLSGAAVAGRFGLVSCSSMLGRLFFTPKKVSAFPDRLIRSRCFR
jgi:hypothetical protein